tara:strand:- start:67 stop:900 length:834 start_codon:yes stop_codon:yes gene_type:complete
MYPGKEMAEGPYVEARVEDLQYYVDNSADQDIQRFLRELFVHHGLTDDIDADGTPTITRLLLNILGVEESNKDLRQMQCLLFSKQLIKLEDDIQIKCVAFISWQAYLCLGEQIYASPPEPGIGSRSTRTLVEGIISRPSEYQPGKFPHVETLLIDIYSLFRMLYYLGYGKDYTQKEGREDISHIKSGFNIVVLYGGEGTDCPSFANDTYPFLVTNHHKQAGLGICYNNTRGHVAGPSFFIRNLLTDYWKYSSENNSLVKKEPDISPDQTDCVYVDPK